jgi:hypothetical protein
MNLKTMADKDNAVPGRVATVPLDLAIGHYKTLSGFDVRTVSFAIALPKYHHQNTCARVEFQANAHG